MSLEWLQCKHFSILLHTIVIYFLCIFAPFSCWSTCYLVFPENHPGCQRCSVNCIPRRVIYFVFLIVNSWWCSFLETTDILLLYCQELVNWYFFLFSVTGSKDNPKLIGIYAGAKHSWLPFCWGKNITRLSTFNGHHEHGWLQDWSSYGELSHHLEISFPTSSLYSLFFLRKTLSKH